MTFPNGVAPQQYSPPCIAVKVGQSVAFAGNFSAHPLLAKGGNAGGPLPVVAEDTGSAHGYTFTTAGTFGFGCANHAAMQGAVLVTP